MKSYLPSSTTQIVIEVVGSRAFSDFCGADSGNQVPNGDTLRRFRNLLIQNEIQELLFAQVVELLAQRGLILKKGTIVDSTIIEAPTSTKNREKKRDSDAHQVYRSGETRRSHNPMRIGRIVRCCLK